jgi:WD40 repeat protein
MKNKIDLEVENLKKRIDNEYALLFNKIDHFENKCKETLSKINKIENNEKSVNELKTKWEAIKRNPSFNPDGKNNLELKGEIETKVDELEKKLKEFESIKCTIDRLKFSPKAHPFSESLSGGVEDKGRKFKLITGGFDSNIKISDVENEGQVETLTGHLTNINSLAVNDDFLLSGSEDGEIKVWDLNTHSCIRTLKQHFGIESLVITEHGNELLSGLSDGTILKWNLKDWKIMDSFKEHTKSIVTMVLLQNNQLASCSHDRTIKIWDLSKDKSVKTLNDGSSIVCMVVYKYNNLITGHCKVFKGLIKMWNIDSGICFKTFKGI